jgi:hypothetical protein
VSYDVFLQRFQGGEAATVDSPEVWALLEAAWDVAPDEHGYCLVRRGEDEGDLYAEQRGRPLESLMFNHAGPGIYELMFELAVAGDMVIMPPDAGPFLVREEQRSALPRDLAEEAVVVENGAALVRAIETS